MALDWTRLEKLIADFKEARATPPAGQTRRQIETKFRNDLRNEMQAMVAEVSKGEALSGDDIQKFNEAKTMFDTEIGDYDAYAAATRLQQLIDAGDRVGALAFARVAEPLVMQADFSARKQFGKVKKSIPKTDDESEAARDTKRAEVLTDRAQWLDTHIEAATSGREEDTDRLDKWLEQTVSEADKAAESVGAE